MGLGRILVCVGILTAAVSFAACGGGKKANNPSSSMTPSEEDGGDGFGGAFSDGGADEGGGAATAEIPGGGGGTEASAKAFLEQFLKPDAKHAELTKSMRPSTADYKAMFDEATAPKIEAAQAKEWDSGKAVIQPKAKQTEVKVFGATGADIAAGKGNAGQFPGGYKKVGEHLLPTQMYFTFKFVQPGQDKGMEFDGLAFVNGHWVIAFKPWRALEDGGGGGGKGGGKGGGGKKGGGKKK